MRPTESTEPAPVLRRLVLPALPWLVQSVGGLVFVFGVLHGLRQDHALFPRGTAGWGLVVLTAVLIAHLVAPSRRPRPRARHRAGP